MPLRLGYTSRPLEAEETLLETADRLESTALALLGDVRHLRRRLKTELAPPAKDPAR